MIQEILSKAFKAREKVAKDLTAHETRKRRAKDPDWNPDEEYDDEEKPFLEHLEDLRSMLVRIVATLLIATVVCFTFHRQLIDVIKLPLEMAGLEQSVAKKVELPPEGSKARPFSERYRIGEELPVEDLLAGDLFYDLGEGRLKFYDGEGWYPVDGKERGKMSLTTVDVTGVFMMSVKVALFSAIVVSFPLLIYFLLQFVLPGLKRKEKRVLWPSMVIGFGLFALGVVFAYFVVLPRALEFFHVWAERQGVDTIWTIEKYVTFCTRFLLVFGLCFELPVVVMALVKIDLLNYSIMKNTRRHAIVGIFVFAAIVTPTTDPGTLMLLAVPMYLLYELCIWIAYYMEKKDRELYPELYEAWDKEHDDDQDPWEWDHEEDEEEEGAKKPKKKKSKGGAKPVSAAPLAYGGTGEKEGDPEKEEERELTLEEISYLEEHDWNHLPKYTEKQLMRKRKDELIEIAESLGCPSYGTKKEITAMILDHC